MSNRRRARPAPPSAVRAYAANYKCTDCDSDVDRPRPDRHHPGVWHIPIHLDDTCPVLAGRVSTRTAGLAAGAKVATSTRGRVAYLYRAVDQHGQVIDVLVSTRRDAAAAQEFFTQALRLGAAPVEVNTDWAPVYPR